MNLRPGVTWDILSLVQARLRHVRGYSHVQTMGVRRPFGIGFQLSVPKPRPQVLHVPRGILFQ